MSYLLPVLGSPDTLVQAVPIDYAVEAGLAIARARDTVGRTFNIVEASPPSLGQVFRTLSDLVGRPAPVGALPLAITRMLTRLPGLHRLVHAQRALLEEMGRSVRVEDAQARQTLARAGLACPSLLAHLPRLVQHVAEHRGGMAPRFTFAPQPATVEGSRCAKRAAQKLRSALDRSAPRARERSRAYLPASVIELTRRVGDATEVLRSRSLPTASMRLSS